MKSLRQEKIIEIINKRNIENQNQLMNALLAEGIKSTQATLSRDIRDLHLVKEMSAEGSYRYVLGTRDGIADHEQRLRKIFRECILDCKVAQNLIVIKTLPGLANAACSALDNMDIYNLVGSIAGDDTAFLAMKDNASAEHFLKEIDKLL